MKTVIKALLAASMLMPIAAQAQEQDGRQRGEGRRGGWGERAPRAERSADVGVEAQVRAERPQRVENRAERQQAAPQDRQDGARWQRGDRADANRDQPRTSDRGDQARQQQWREQQARQQQFGAEQQRGGGFRNRDDDRRGRQNAGVDPRQDYRRDRQDDRRPAFAQNNGNRGDWRGNDGRDRDGRNWNDGRRFDNRGGAWNRGWRNDNRYDWNRYRQVNRSAYRLPRYYAPSGWGYGYRRFSVGVSLSSILFSQNYWIDDPFNYRLPEAYGPYRWVRYYDDALLVDLRSGQVVDTVYDIFD